MPDINFRHFPHFIEPGRRREAVEEPEQKDEGLREAGELPPAYGEEAFGVHAANLQVVPGAAQLQRIADAVTHVIARSSDPAVPRVFGDQGDAAAQRFFQVLYEPALLQAQNDARRLLQMCLLAPAPTAHALECETIRGLQPLLALVKLRQVEAAFRARTALPDEQNLALNQLRAALESAMAQVQVREYVRPAEPAVAAPDPVEVARALDARMA